MNGLYRFLLEIEVREINKSTCNILKNHINSMLHILDLMQQRLPSMSIKDYCKLCMEFIIRINR